MQELTVKIPDSKLDFFMELVQNLGFVEVESHSSNKILTDEQIELVNIERKKARETPNYMLEWKEARKTLRFK